MNNNPVLMLKGDEIHEIDGIENCQSLRYDSVLPAISEVTTGDMVLPEPIRFVHSLPTSHGRNSLVLLSFPAQKMKMTVDYCSNLRHDNSRYPEMVDYTVQLPPILMAVVISAFNSGYFDSKFGSFLGVCGTFFTKQPFRDLDCDLFYPSFLNCPVRSLPEQIGLSSHLVPVICMGTVVSYLNFKRSISVFDVAASACDRILFHSTFNFSDSLGSLSSYMPPYRPSVTAFQDAGEFFKKWESGNFDPFTQAVRVGYNARDFVRACRNSRCINSSMHTLSMRGLSSAQTLSHSKLYQPSNLIRC